MVVNAGYNRLSYEKTYDCHENQVPEYVPRKTPGDPRASWSNSLTEEELVIQGEYKWAWKALTFSHYNTKNYEICKKQDWDQNDC